MGWHHRPGDVVELRYRRPQHFPFAGCRGSVLIRPGKGRGPRNFAVALDGGPVVVVPGGNLRSVKP